MNTENNFLLHAGRTGDGHERLICKKLPEDRSIIKKIAEHYAGMLKSYDQRYANKSDFSMYFKLHTDEFDFTLENKKELINALAKLSETDGFEIIVKYNTGNVSVQIEASPEIPNMYFGEFSTPITIEPYLNDQLRECIEYSYFYWSFDGYLLFKFDSNGITDVTENFTLDLNPVKHITNWYTKGVSITCNILENDGHEEKAIKLQQEFLEIAKKYIPQDQLDYTTSDEPDLLLSDVQWFLSSAAELKNFVEEINILGMDTDKIIIDGCWIDIDEFALMTIEIVNGKLAVIASKF